MELWKIIALLAVAGFILWRVLPRQKVEAIPDPREQQRDHDLSIMREMARKIVTRSDGYDVMPSYNSMIRLDAGEVSYCECAASLLALRTTSTITAYHGVTGRLPVAKGISYRAGVIQSTSIPIEEMREVDQGIVAVTSRRVIFHGSKGNSSVQIGKVIAAYGGEDGFVRLDRDNGKPLMIESPHSVLVFAVIQRLLDDRAQGIETQHRYVDLEAARQSLK